MRFNLTMSANVTRTATLGAARPRAVLIDVGFTLTAFDGARIAALAGEAGVTASGAAIEATEEAIRRDMLSEVWAFTREGEGAKKAVALYRRMLSLAAPEASGAALQAAAEHVWASHLENNLWTRILPGVPEALRLFSERGLPMAVVSNSEGNIEAALREIGLHSYFRTVLDSTVVGVAKPAPRIFELALAAVGCAPGEAIMVGDSPTADVLGARGLGIAAALLDPFDLHTGVDAPRFPSLAAVAAAVCAEE